MVLFDTFELMDLWVDLLLLVGCNDIWIDWWMEELSSHVSSQIKGVVNLTN